MKQVWKRSVLICIGLVSAVLIMFLLLNYANAPERIVIAKVNEDEVTLREFTQELDSQGSSDSPDVSMERSLHEIIRRKVQLQLAKEYGLVQDISYSSIIKEMDNENKRRKDAAAQNLPVYGPVEMDENTFVNYYISNLVAELKNHLGITQLAATDEELRFYYLEVRDLFYQKEDTILYQKVSVSYRNFDQGVDEAKKKELAQKSLNRLKTEVFQGMTLPDTLDVTRKEFDDIVINLSKEEFNDEVARYYIKNDPLLYEEIKKLDALNPVSNVFETGVTGEFVLLFLLDRQNGGYITFEECKNNVEFSYLDRAYSDLIDNLVNKADVKFFKDMYNQIDFK